MVTFLLIFSLIHPLGQAKFIKVTGVVGKKKLVVYRSNKGVEIERMDAEFQQVGDTLVVELHGDRGVVIGGAGALLGLPPLLTKIYLKAKTAEVLLDITNLPVKTLKIDAKASFLTIVDDSTSRADTISLTLSLSKLKYIGAGMRKCEKVLFNFNSSVIKLLFSAPRWQSFEILSTFSSIGIFGSIPVVRTNGILNFVRGRRPAHAAFTLNLSGSLNVLKLNTIEGQ